MVTGQKLTVTIKGGSPWGFRLQGGGNFPLEVAKVSSVFTYTNVILVALRILVCAIGGVLVHNDLIILYFYLSTFVNYEK